MTNASETPNPSPPPSSGTACGRFLHLRFPRLSTDRLSLERAAASPLEDFEFGRRSSRPLVAYETVGQALRVVAVDAIAEAAGLEAGLTLKAARARLPVFDAAPHDALADAGLMKTLAGLCRRYTPAVVAAPPDALRLNLTGCERLFGGEANLVADLLSRLKTLGMEVRYGLADTPGLALALCGWSAKPQAAPGEREAVLAPLPIGALHLHPSDEAALIALGLRRVGQLLDRPSFIRSGGELSDVFEGRLLRRLDEVLGRFPEPLPLRLEPPPFRAEQKLFEPVWLEPQILGLARRLAESLCEQMARRGCGARMVALDLFRVDGAVKRLSVRTARPLRDPEAIAKLFQSRLAGLGQEGLEADYGFDLLRLCVLRSEDATAVTRDLLGEDDPQTRFAAFAESVQARLGPDAVLVPKREPSTQKPEREWGLRPLIRLTRQRRALTELPPEAPTRFGETPLLPMRLFRPPQPIDVIAGVPEDPPARFVWRRQAYTVIRAEGPERLSPEWVREPEARERDYYRVEARGGQRFWVFREGRHTFGAPDPSWFLHGLFA